MHKFALRSFFLVFLQIAVFSAGAQTSGSDASADSSKAAIEQVLHTQQDAWNHHDLDAFMAGYWNSADLTFSLRGQANQRMAGDPDRYKTTYASPGHEMGTLRIFRPTYRGAGPDAAFVRGAHALP